MIFRCADVVCVTVMDDPKDLLILFGYVIELAADILLAYAAKKQSPVLILPWLVINSLLMLLLVVSYCTGLSYFFST